MNFANTLDRLEFERAATHKFLNTYQTVTVSFVSRTDRRLDEFITRIPELDPVLRTVPVGVQFVDLRPSGRGHVRNDQNEQIQRRLHFEKIKSFGPPMFVALLKIMAFSRSSPGDGAKRIIEVTGTTVGFTERNAKTAKTVVEQRTMPAIVLAMQTIVRLKSVRINRKYVYDSYHGRRSRPIGNNARPRCVIYQHNILQRTK